MQSTSSFRSADFNPRSRVGNDINPLGFCQGGFYISIHVPAWGTTDDNYTYFTVPTISIHVPAWGTTEKRSYHGIHQMYFNPRSRVGNDCKVIRLKKLILDFNPRSRVGNDPKQLRFLVKTHLISIHIPAWGTTLSQEDYRPYGRISIHVPAWGTTLYINDFLISNFISIHVPAWGTTNLFPY